MKKGFLLMVFSAVLFSAAAQEDWNYINKSNTVSADTITKGRYTLVFINQAPDFSENVKQRLTEVFFKVYPKAAKLYNKSTTDSVIFIIDPGYRGVAAASGRIIRFDPEWFRKNPNDVDVVTHETMHIIQGYPDWGGPGWITEGIADYVRLTLGVDNKGANWKVPDLNPSQTYTDAYRVTARFFYWIEKKKSKGIVKKLDSAMRSQTYKDAFWLEHTGKTIDELWNEYRKSVLVVVY